MSEAPRYTGHLVQGCQGQWVDVSSLAEPQVYVCPLCRAEVADPEELDPGPGNPPDQVPQTEQRAPPKRFWPFLRVVLRALGLLAICGLGASSFLMLSSLLFGWP